MSIEGEKKLVEIITEHRTWRMEFFTEKNTDYRVVVHREDIETDEDGNIRRQSQTRPVERRLADVAGESYDFGKGLVLTGAQVAGILSKIGDIWYEEDKNAAAQRVMLEEEQEKRRAEIEEQNARQVAAADEEVRRPPEKYEEN